MNMSVAQRYLLGGDVYPRYKERRGKLKNPCLYFSEWVDILNNNETIFGQAICSVNI